MKAVTLPDCIHKSVKILAIENNTTIKEYIQELIRKDLKARDNEERTGEVRNRSKEFEFQRQAKWGR